MSNKLYILILSAILVLGASFRLLGINWDQNQHLHPDERFLTMVTLSVHWPKNISQYFDTKSSPLNPHNTGNAFFVYGRLPLFIVKAFSSTYDQTAIAGRIVSAVMDVGTILLVALISLEVFASRKSSLLAMLFYGLAVLPIQLSHFYAVDTFLVFFLTLCLYFSLKHKFVLSGIALGLALACKITAIFIVPSILILLIRHGLRKKSMFLFALFAIVVLRVADPYLFQGFSINPLVVANLKQLEALSNPNGFFPPGIQWIKTLPFIFPMENLILWGLGLPLSAIAILGTTLVIFKKPSFSVLALLTNLLIVIGIESFQFAKPLRYFYPVYPIICIFAADFAANLKIRYLFPLLVMIAVWPISFVQIYLHPHSRVAASRWLVENLPPGSTISCEYWDDCLPVGVPNSFNSIQLAPYDPESPIKWADFAAKLARVDYIILSSNRLYGSIMTVPEKYPQTLHFYESLFDGSLGFTKIAEFTSRPNLPIPGVSFCLTPPFINYGKIAFNNQYCGSGISFVDDYSDESFTVYDHPKVIIFKKTSTFSTRL